MSPVINVIIPARSGSKGIKNKNLCKILGVPLYKRSINHALKLKEYFDVRIWLSTDIKEILNKKDFLDQVYICERKKELSGDHVLTLEVVKDLIKDKKFSDNDLVVLLQPTSPFRKIEEIRQSINILLFENKWKSIVSLSEVTSNHPFRMKRLTSNHECIDFIDQGFEDMRPRQNLTKVYIRSGNFYISYVSALLKDNSLLPRPTKGIVHNDPKYSINIDNLHDLYLAEIVGKNYQINA